MPDAGRGIVAIYDIRVLVMSFEELDAIQSLHIVSMAFKIFVFFIL